MKTSPQNTGESIQCFKCESINGNDIGCEIGKRDNPYSNPCYVGVSLHKLNNNNSIKLVYDFWLTQETIFLQVNSYVKGNRCIKIVGISAYDNQRVVIRDCTDRTHDKEGK